MRTLMVLAALLLIPGLVLAQQTGDANRDYTINSTGSLGTSFVIQNVYSGTVLNSVYSTAAPGSPVLWAASTTGNLGGLFYGPNSIDLGTPSLGYADITFLLNGTLPGIPAALFQTGFSGTFSAGAVAGSSLIGIPVYLAFLHLTPTSPVGLYISQTHQLNVSALPPLPPAPTGCSPVSPSLGLSDDSFTIQPLGFSFSIYGTAYTQVGIASNGSLTFGGGDPTWGAETELISIGYPIVHLWQRDLYPPGSVASGFQGIGYTLGTPGVVTYDKVPPCCSPYTGTNGISMCINIVPGYISVRYTENGLMSYGNVGIGPGVAAPQSAVDLSLGGGIATGSSVFEAAPPDLLNFTLTWLLDPSGNPVFYAVY